MKKKEYKGVDEFEEKLRESINSIVVDAESKKRIWNNIKKELEVSQIEK